MKIDDIEIFKRLRVIGGTHEGYNVVAFGRDRGDEWVGLDNGRRYHPSQLEPVIDVGMKARVTKGPHADQEHMVTAITRNAEDTIVALSNGAWYDINGLEPAPIYEGFPQQMLADPLSHPDCCSEEIGCPRDDGFGPAYYQTARKESPGFDIHIDHFSLPSPEHMKAIVEEMKKKIYGGQVRALNGAIKVGVAGEDLEPGALVMMNEYGQLVMKREESNTEVPSMIEEEKAYVNEHRKAWEEVQESATRTEFWADRIGSRILFEGRRDILGLSSGVILEGKLLEISPSFGRMCVEVVATEKGETYERTSWMDTTNLREFLPPLETPETPDQ